MKTILFKGKTKEGYWVEGYLFKNIMPLYTMSFIIKNGFVPALSMPRERFTEVINESICQFTGHYLIKGDKVFTNTIAFEEIERNEGDERIYFICKYIEEIGLFAWLTGGELIEYEDTGISFMDRPMFNTYGLECSCILHYAGNYIDNPELLNK